MEGRMSKRNSPAEGIHGAAMESLEDFKRKLDSEHTTVSAKLDQGVRARQELQELKGKLVEDLESSRKSLQARVEKVEAKLGATSKLKRNKEDQVILRPAKNHGKEILCLAEHCETRGSFGPQMRVQGAQTGGFPGDWVCIDYAAIQDVMGATREGILLWTRTAVFRGAKPCQRFGFAL